MVEKTLGENLSLGYFGGAGFGVFREWRGGVAEGDELLATLARASLDAEVHEARPRC